MNIEAVAATCHEANRKLCQLLGDNSQKSWGKSPDWQKESAINGVNFHIANPDAGPKGSHENWMREKLAAGWKHGPEKNVEKKEHPCLVPYADLPSDQQLKDILFVSIVHALKGFVVSEVTG